MNNTVHWLVLRRPLSEILRQVHRWLAVVLAFFVLVIAVTGTSLQAIIFIYGDPGPARFNRLPHRLGLIRVWLLNIHTMFFLGVPSAYYGIICGLGVLFFSISGLWMYISLYRGRAKLGRKGLFWRGRSGAAAVMRSLHRWLTPWLVLFSAMLGFTGASLDFDTARDHNLLYDNPLPGTPTTLSHPGTPTAWHSFIFDLHKLDIAGVTGHLLGVVIGSALSLMAFSGLWIYSVTYFNRAAPGRRTLFW